MTKEQVFLAALELSDEAARVAYLDQACGEDNNLRRQVEGLLSAHFRSGDFLDRPAVQQMAADLDSPHEDATVSVGPEQGAGAGADREGDELQFLEPPGRSDSLGRIGHYEVLQVLGKGGFGIVFRAFDEALQRVVAVKVLAPSLAVTSPARKRFLREARSSAAVRHENVVQVHAVEEQPLPFLVMDFIPGETLQQRLDRTGPLDLLDILRIGRQVAEGLAAAHAQDLIHRDVKPANVLIESGPNGRVRLTDFGLARAADDASLTQSGVAAGTPLYMAPEQARGDALDHRADLFSLGSVLYVMCTGRPPFRANNTLAILKRVAEDTPRPIRQVISEVPDWLCHIVEKLHAKDPAQRFQSAREVADVLADCEAQVRSHGVPRDFSRISGGQPRRLLPRLARWAAAAALLAVLGVALVWWRGWVTGLFTPRNSGAAQQQTPHSPGDRELPPTRPTPPPLAVVPFDAEKAKAHQQAWAKFLGTKPAFTNTIGMELCVIPPGDFLMGSSAEDVEEVLKRVGKADGPGYRKALTAETPQHLVRITRPFAIGATEVTVGQFRQFVQERKYRTTVEQAGGWGYKNDEFVSDKEFNWDNVGYKQADLAPVWNVSWDDAVEFCKWLSQKEGKTYRLPTEAEWEWACRAGTASRTYWGNVGWGLYAWGPGKLTPGGHPQPVRQKTANPFGLYDTCGNVLEWCSDWYSDSYYADSPLADPAGPPGPQGGPMARHHVQRGGGVVGRGRGVNSVHRMPEWQEPAGFRIVCEFPGDVKLPAPASQPTGAIVPFDAEKAKAHQQAWAKHLGLLVEFTNKSGLEMRVIPPGDFLMGSKESDVKDKIDNAETNRPPGFTFLIRSLRSETPQHPVRITRPFAIGKYEVTVGQFKKFVTATGYKTTAEQAGGWGFKDGSFVQSREFNWKNVGYEQADLAPVWNVSWDDAREFCRWLTQQEGQTYRLPTEAEWEWACRAGTATRTFWDGPKRASARLYAWGGAKSGHHPQPVGKLKPNAFGLHDTCGNVWEWCHDWYVGTSYKEDARNSPAIDPTGPEARENRALGHRVQRGGGVWGGQFGICSTARSAARQEVVGFRVVGDLATNRKRE